MVKPRAIHIELNNSGEVHIEQNVQAIRHLLQANVPDPAGRYAKPHGAYGRMQCRSLWIVPESEKGRFISQLMRRLSYL